MPVFYEREPADELTLAASNGREMAGCAEINGWQTDEAVAVATNEGNAIGGLFRQMLHVCSRGAVYKDMRV